MSPLFFLLRLDGALLALGHGETSLGLTIIDWLVGAFPAALELVLGQESSTFPMLSPVVDVN